MQLPDTRCISQSINRSVTVSALSVHGRGFQYPRQDRQEGGWSGLHELPCPSRAEQTTGGWPQSNPLQSDPVLPLTCTLCNKYPPCRPINAWFLAVKSPVRIRNKFSYILCSVALHGVSSKGLEKEREHGVLAVKWKELPLVQLTYYLHLLTREPDLARPWRPPFILRWDSELNLLD